MSVLIKDMEKPKSCYAVIDGEAEFCPFVNTDDDCVLLLKKGICEGTWEMQYSKCPLVEVTEPCEDPRADVYYLAEKIGIHRLYELVVGLRGEPEPFDDDKGCSNCMYSGRPTYKSPCAECRDNSQWEMKPISRSHENGTECEDAVSRKAAIEAVMDLCKHYTLTKSVNHPHVDFVIEALQDLPPVTPKRKTGRWIELSNTNHTYICSECGRMLVNISDGKNMVAKNYPFCHCGAEMDGSE